MVNRLCFAGWASWMAAISGITAQPISAADVPPAFTPPANPVTLTRTLYRPLPDGKEIVARRRYEIRVFADGEGFRLDGRLLDVGVDAPPQLAGLAELEKTRPEPDLFPILLNRHGLMLNRESAPIPPDQTNRIMARAQALITDTLPSKAHVDATRALNAFGKALKASPWPQGLFNPGTAAETIKHEVKLPDGSLGQVTVTIRAAQSNPGHMPEWMERTITTRLAGTERSTREVWTFSF